MFVHNTVREYTTKLQRPLFIPAGGALVEFRHAYYFHLTLKHIHPSNVFTIYALNRLALCWCASITSSQAQLAFNFFLFSYKLQNVFTLTLTTVVLPTILLKLLNLHFLRPKESTAVIYEWTQESSLAAEISLIAKRKNTRR